MPELSRFFGIVVRMFAEAGGSHSRPHLHAYFGEYAAVYGIDVIERMAGELPTPQERLVVAWAEIHREELRQAWASLQEGRTPAKIDPLR
jgi:hypothetical protein